MTPRRKRLLISFASFFGLIGAFLIIEHFRGSWALDRWKARTAAKGDELSIGKLAPPVPLAHENGMPELLWIAGQLGTFPFDLQPPAGRYAAPGKWVVITGLNDWQFRNSRRTNATWMEIGESLAECDDRIRAALDALQSSAFDANLFYRAGPNMPMYHLSRIKGLAQFLSTAALHDLHQVQTAAAFHKLQGLLRLPEVLKDERTVISQLVRVAVMHIGFTATWHALQHEGWTDAQLAALQDAWGAYDFLRTMDSAVAMERASAVAEYERCRSSDVPLSSMFNPGAPVAPAATPSLLSWNWVGQLFDPRERIFAPLWRFAWSRQDELHHCETVQEILEIHRQGVKTKSGVPALARMERVESMPLNVYDRMRFLIGRAFGGYMASSLRRAWIAQTTAEIGRTAIAIKRYELREGKLPPDLKALVTDFLADVPVDWMDGRPLRFCVDGDSFRLYSVGVDGQDGLGDATAGSSTSKSLSYQNTRDLVWPQLADELETLNWQTSRR